MLFGWTETSPVWSLYCTGMPSGAVCCLSKGEVEDWVASDTPLPAVGVFIDLMLLKVLLGEIN